MTCFRCKGNFSNFDLFRLEGKTLKTLFPVSSYYGQFCRDCIKPYRKLDAKLNKARKRRR